MKVGSAVKRFKEGDIAAVGCLVDSCRKCPSCLAGEEQYCENKMILTYQGEDKILGGGEITRFVCGFLVCEPRLSEVFLAGLPPMLKVPVAKEPSGRWLEHSIRLSRSAK